MQLCAKFDSPETSNGVILCNYSSNLHFPDFELIKDASSYTLIGTVMDKVGRKRFLPAHINDFDYGAWNHIAFSVRRAFELRDWGDAMLVKIVN